jgi:hypothetical protein
MWLLSDCIQFSVFTRQVFGCILFWILCPLDCILGVFRLYSTVVIWYAGCILCVEIIFWLNMSVSWLNMPVTLLCMVKFCLKMFESRLNMPGSWSNTPASWREHACNLTEHVCMLANMLVFWLNMAVTWLYSTSLHPT